MLNEESILLAQRWDALEDVMRALQQLRSDVERILLAVEPRLRCMPWWDRNWRFERDVQKGYAYATGIYVARVDWMVDREPTLRIGVEGFTPEALFGNDEIATLYVKAGDRSVAPRIVAFLKARDNHPIGDTSWRDKGDVVTEILEHCLPDQVELLPEQTIEQVSRFIDHYAQLLQHWSCSAR